MHLDMSFGNITLRVARKLSPGLFTMIELRWFEVQYRRINNNEN